MSTLSIKAIGAPAQIARLLAKREAVLIRGGPATFRAAEVFAAALRERLPKRTGRLRRGVKVLPVAPTKWVVAMTGREVHLVYGPTKQHMIQPSAGGDKRAIMWAGADHPVGRAIHPAMAGKPNPIPSVREETAPLADAIAKETLRG